MYRLNISYKRFYTILNEISLYESDLNANSTCSEPGDKRWQHSIRGWRNSYMSVIAPQITGNSTVCSTACSGPPEQEHQISDFFSALWLSVTGGFLSQRASNGKTLWCHHLGTVFKVPMCWNDISHIKSICIQVIQFRSVRIYNGAHTNANVCLFIIYTDMHLYFYSLLFCIEWWKANHQLGIWITRIIKLTKRRHHNSSRVSVTLHLWFTQCYG